MKNRIKLTFLGDIAFFKLFESLQYKKEIKGLFSNYNNIIGNFEFVIPKLAKKKFYDVQDNYKCQYDFIEKLDINFYAFSLANNHVMDYGVDGLLETRNLIEKKGIKVFGVGENNYNVLEFSEENIDICILGCVKKGRWSRNEGTEIGPDTYEPELIIDFIKKNKSIYDHMIIFPHWGTELIDIPNPYDVINARKFIDAGASAVIGHHPHIIQGIEKYKNGLIAYSLGSFLYVHEHELGYQSWQKKRLYSITLELSLSKERIESHEIKFHKYNKITKLPEPTIESSVNKYFSNLCNNISNKGNYYLKKYTILGFREMISFFIRFKKSPIQALTHYWNYITNGR